MQVKSIRIPDELLSAIELVETREHLEESTAIRKLIRTGLETYLARLYRRGDITLREAADRLGLDLITTIELFMDYGIKGNLDAADVLAAVERCGQ